MSVHVEFGLSWLSSTKFPAVHTTTLLDLVAAVRKNGSLKEAASSMGLSYRFTWGLLGTAAEAFGAPLVEMQRGRGARLTRLGEKLLWADGLVRSSLDRELTRLRHEIETGLFAALPKRLPHLVMYASHDLALRELPGLCAGRIDLDVTFHGAEESLEALANERCDVAGFHVADALPRAAAAAAALGRWLDPRRHLLVHFITREQGLIASPKSNIRSVNDLTRPGVRFINRQSGAHERPGTTEDRSVAAMVADGRADAGFGLRADASRFGLEFVPLAIERYFLAFPRSGLRGPPMQALLDILRGRELSERLTALPGYDGSKAGQRAELSAALEWVRRASRRTTKNASRPASRRSAA